MSSTEYAYYELENAKGFKKDYKNGKYSFVALLPNEGISVNELVDSLSYEEMIDMLNAPNYSRDVIAKMPKFSYEYSLKMNDVLSLLGMEKAFDAGSAEFDKIGQKIIIRGSLGRNKSFEKEAPVYREDLTV